MSPATGDDAAVFVLPGSTTALVQTVDFFTPIVDDPYDWGRIGAANAFSDVYAMGGRPVTAMNLVAWPVKELSLDLLAQVLEGGAAVAAEAGATVVGGHSIHDPEPKYGMAVTGFVDVDRVVRNSAMRPGDLLFLTKPIGTGIVTTAHKNGRAAPEQLQAAVDTMTQLNAAASEAMVEAGASAATDVTGFGLLGHLHIALRESGCAAVVDASRVPLLEGVTDLADTGMIPSGTRSNLAFVKGSVDAADVPETDLLVLADAQTSGGMLIAVEEARAADLDAELTSRGVTGVVIGTVAEGQSGRIAVTGRITR